MNWLIWYDTALKIITDWRDPLIALAAVKYLAADRPPWEGINHSLAWIAQMSIEVNKRLKGTKK